MENKRLNNLSLIRLFGALIVFVFHLCFMLLPLQGKNIFPFYFGVQILTFISAFLYSRKEIENKKTFYPSQFKKILIPVVVTFILMILSCLTVYLCNGVYTFNAFISLFGANSVNGGYVLAVGNWWYVPVILLCYCFLPKLSRVFKNKKENQFWLWFAIIVELLIACFFKNPITFAPFFIGFFYGKNYFNNYENYTNQKYKKLVIAFAVFITSLVVYLLTFNLIKSDIYFVMLVKNLIIEVLATLIGISFTIFFIRILAPLNKYSKLTKFCSLTDRYTYTLYLVHQMLMIGGLSLLSITNNLSINILVTFIVAVIAAIIIEEISQIIIKKSRIKKSLN